MCTTNWEMFVEIYSELLLFEKDVLTMINVECATKTLRRIQCMIVEYEKYSYIAVVKFEERHNKTGKMENYEINSC